MIRNLSRRLYSTASAEELAHFSQLAASWWDVDGPQRILHKMNLARLDYIRDTLGRYQSGNLPGYSLELLPETERQKYKDQALSSNLLDNGNIDVLDVGCGGGILSESLARLAGIRHVSGIDLTPEVIAVAKNHMNKDPGLKDKLDYRLMGIDQVPTSETYDLVTMFEILEHVPRPSEVLTAAMDRVKPGGWLFMSTINRTPISYFTTIFMGEHVLKIVPQGTHTYSKYINEHELREWIVKQPNWQFVRSNGCMYVPFNGWILNSCVSMGNYFIAARKCK